MDLNLTGKRALVGGASQGIGRAVATELAALGATVTVFGRNPESLEQVRTSLPTASEQSHNLLVADFTRPEEVKRSVDRHLGETGPIQILVNNTGGPPP